MTRLTPDAPVVNIEYDDDKHYYKVNGRDVPSVTQILDATLPKDALTWWGFRVGMGAVIELARQGKLTWTDIIARHDSHEEILAGEPSKIHAVARAGDPQMKKPKTLVEAIAQDEKLDPNSVRNKAAGRGTGTHEALILLAAEGMPIVDDLPEVQRGFVRGLLKWYLEQEPQFVEGGVEQLVAYAPESVDSCWYSGRFDLLTRDPDGALVLNDLKTGKELRADSWFRQLMGYKLAYEWMGFEKIERLRSILCKADGTYAVYDATSKVNPRQWWACVEGFYAADEFTTLNAKGSRRRKFQ